MIKLAIVGTGGIAHWHAQSFQSIEGVQIVGACDIDNDKVEAFTNEYNIENTYNSFDDLLEHCEFDAISNATPDPFHKEIALKAIKKNKHVFSEKPLAENYPDAKEMYEAIKDTNLINMVNFTYRNSSGYQKLAKVVQSGEIGKVRHVDATYYQAWLTSKYSGDYRTQNKRLWRLSTAHGSMGTLGDLGVHIFDFASYPVGQITSINSRLKTFKDKGEKIGEYVLDANDTFISMIEFDNGAIGTVSATRFATGFKDRLDLKIFGDLGAVKIGFEDPIEEGNQYQITKDTERERGKSDKLKWDTINTKPTPNNFERFIESIKNKTNDQPDFKRGTEIQKILDSCIKSSEENKWIAL